MPNSNATPAANGAATMRWATRLGSIRGIDIFIHWTFTILLLFILLNSLMVGQDLLSALWGLALICAVFVCVLLHELGHALTAQKFGVRTRDITLLPIGGVAKLERIPENPAQELAIVAAGPAVNLVIAAILFLFLWAQNGFMLQNLPTRSFAGELMWINVTLLVFNLIPAFPMDGGRLLRALLARRMEYLRATRIAARAGQFFAVLFGIAGLMMPNPFLVFIALFVYAGAQQEYESTRTRTLLHGVPVRAAMITDFTTLSTDDTLAVAVEKLLHGSQEDFPVVTDGKVVGLLTRNRMIEALAQQGPSMRVEKVMEHNCPCVQESESLEDTVQQMRESGCPAEPVLRNDQLVGLLTLEHVTELAQIQSALRTAHA
jgi:Zn-dependent protease/predicted transcriptional regulator